METAILNFKGEEVGKLEIKDSWINHKVSAEFLHEYMTVYLANQRACTAHAKTRAEVSGGGHKPWKQKHTGRARAGSNRSPLWRHGGVVFGPRYYLRRLDLPRRKRQEALLQAIAARWQEGGVVLVENFSLDEAKTKAVIGFLGKIGAKGSTLFVSDRREDKLLKASRNIKNLEVLLPNDLNAYLVLRSKKLVISRTAFERLSSSWN